MIGAWISRGVQAGDASDSTGEQGCSERVDASSVTLESAVEREEEREGSSGSGRGERQSSDGEISCNLSSFSGGTYLSGSGGTMSVVLKSGHAPGKEGVGEVGTMVKRRMKERGSERDKEGERNGMFINITIVGTLQGTFDSV